MGRELPRASGERAPPLRTLLDGGLVRRGVYPHLDVDRVGSVVDRVLQVGVLLIGTRDQPDNGDLVEVLAVHGETVVAAGGRRDRTAVAQRRNFFINFVVSSRMVA